MSLKNLNRSVHFKNGWKPKAQSHIIFKQNHSIFLSWWWWCWWWWSFIPSLYKISSFYIYTKLYTHNIHPKSIINGTLHIIAAVESNIIHIYNSINCEFFFILKKFFFMRVRIFLYWNTTKIYLQIYYDVFSSSSPSSSSSSLSFLIQCVHKVELWAVEQRSGCYDNNDLWCVKTRRSCVRYYNLLKRSTTT